jgi:transglutaminase-like putative cysteine protease
MSVATATVGARPLATRGSVTTTLVMLLLATTGWSVLSGGWSDSSPTVLLVGIAGAVEALVLARARVPRLLALTSAPLLLLASLLPATVGSRPATAASGFPHLVAEYAAAAATGLLGNSRWEFNVGLAALLWVCGAWAAWFAIRERRGAIATAPCWAVLAVNVINAPAADSVGVPVTIAAVAAIMLIAAVHLDRLNDGWQHRGVRVLPGTDGRFAAAAAAGGVIIAVLALVVPPLTSTDLSARLFGFGGHSQVPGGNGHTFAVGTVQFNPATIPGGALTLSNQPILTYRTNSSATSYLRMVTDSVFTDGAWIPDTSGNNSDIVVVTSPAGPLQRDRIVDDGGVGGAQKSVTATILVSADNSGNDIIPFPGEPDSSSILAHVTGISPLGALGGLLTVDSASSSGSLVGASFSTTGTISTATAGQLRNAGSAYPDFIDREFLTLPDNNSGETAVIRQLAQQWTVNATSPYDEATAIENHLRNPQLFHYTLNPPVPDENGPTAGNIWPVVYFLTTSHAGYCQYFASAMGSMLRSLGIPARLVNGYGPGSSPESAGHNNNVLTHTITSNDAHTWVEAYFPLYGWIPFEPTPPSQLGDYEPFLRGGATPPPTSTSSSTPTPKPSKSARASAAPTATPVPLLSDAGGGSTVPPALADATLGVLGVLIVAITAITWFLRPRNMRGVWRRVGLLGRVLGVRRDPALTYDEYARRLAAAVPPDSTSLAHRGGGARNGATPLRRRTAEALADIAAVSDHVTFGAGAPHPRELVRMRRAWWRIARVAPRLGWRAILSRSATP